MSSLSPLIGPATSSSRADELVQRITEAIHLGLLSDGEQISREHLNAPSGLQTDSMPQPAAPAPIQPFQCGLLPLAEVQARYLQWAVRHSQLGRKELAARPQITERTLYRQLAALEKKTPT